MPVLKRLVFIVLFPLCVGVVVNARIQKGDRGSGPPPPGNHKAIGFFSNPGPKPLENHKLPSQHSMMGYHRPFKWRFAGRPMMAYF